MSGQQSHPQPNLFGCTAAIQAEGLVKRGQRMLTGGAMVAGSFVPQQTMSRDNTALLLPFIAGRRATGTRYLGRTGLLAVLLNQTPLDVLTGLATDLASRLFNLVRVALWSGSCSWS